MTDGEESAAGENADAETTTDEDHMGATDAINPSETTDVGETGEKDAGTGADHPSTGEKEIATTDAGISKKIVHLATKSDLVHVKTTAAEIITIGVAVAKIVEVETGVMNAAPKDGDIRRSAVPHTMATMTGQNHHAVVSLTNMMTDGETETNGETGTITNPGDKTENKK